MTLSKPALVKRRILGLLKGLVTCICHSENWVGRQFLSWAKSKGCWRTWADIMLRASLPWAKSKELLTHPL